MQIIEQLQQRYPTNHIDIKTLLADFFRISEVKGILSSK